MTQAHWLAVALCAWGMTVSAESAYALEVTFPAKTRAKASVVVDEEGTPLFGAIPGQVEITNPSISVEVMNPTPCDCGSTAPAPGLPFRASFNTAGAWAPLVTVPAGKTYTVTDVVIGDPQHNCQLRVNGNPSLFSTYDNHSFTTGLEFVEGDVVEVTVYGATCLITGVVRDVTAP